MDVRVADPLVGRELDGRYLVRARVARGGMATVYVALDRRLDREVALKVMHANLAEDDEFVRRFTREARSAARLTHPGVVQVYDQGEDAGVVFLAMELVPGRTLRDLMTERGALTARETLDLLEPVLDALAAAHRAGIVHRDIKPENVLLADDGRIKVADFGLARAVNSATTSQTGLLLGTVAYLAPEQVERGLADARSDVYAAGVLLFEMLTGAKPFEGETAVQIAFQHVTSEVPAPSTRARGVPPAMDELVAAAAARVPDERPADARELLMLVRETRRLMSAADLDRRVDAAASPGADRRGRALSGQVDGRTSVLALEGGHPTGVVPPGPSGRRRRHAGRLALFAVLLVATVLGVGAWYLGAGPGAATSVPALVGLERAEAQQALAVAGLDGRISEQFSERVAAGRVVSADPDPGTSLRKGSSVAVVVSKGRERYAVPTLAGLSEAAARKALTDGNLAVGRLTRDHDEKVAAGRVLRASVPPGTKVRRGTAVDLVVSRGRMPIAIRSYVGQSADTARAALTKAGLEVRVAEEFSRTVPQGRVIAQTPSSGQRFRGAQVRLTVSKGPELVTVPRVVGTQEGAARATLESLGFTVRVERVLGGYFGSVRSQDPAAGERVPAGSTITLTVV